MKRKLPEDAERKEMAKRPKVRQTRFMIFSNFYKTIQDEQIIVNAPELPSDMWFIILDALCDGEHVTGRDVWILVAFLSSVSKRLQIECQRFKQKKNLKWITIPAGDDFGILFSKFGWLNCLEYLVERGVKLTSPVSCLLAASEGHLECLKYLHSKGVALNHSEELACYGTLDCLKYIHECQGGKWKSPREVCIKAASSDNLDMLKFVHETGGLWSAEACAGTAMMGRLDMLKYALENGCERDSEVYRQASREGHLNIVQYAHENGWEWNSDVVYGEACMKGHRNIVQYAHENGCPWDDECVQYAAINLDLLTYLHENVTRVWREGVCFQSAFWGNLPCLIYAHEHGAPIDRFCPAIAARRGHDAIVEYLHDIGWPLVHIEESEWDDEC